MLHIRRATLLLRFLIMSPDPYFFIFNFRAIRNILVVLGRIIEQVHMESHI